MGFFGGWSVKPEMGFGNAHDTYNQCSGLFLVHPRHPSFPYARGSSWPRVHNEALDAIPQPRDHEEHPNANPTAGGYGG